MNDDEKREFARGAALVAGFEGAESVTVDSDRMAWVHWRGKSAPVGMAPDGFEGWTAEPAKAPE